MSTLIIEREQTSFPMTEKYLAELSPECQQLVGPFLKTEGVKAMKDEVRQIAESQEVVQDV